MSKYYNHILDIDEEKKLVQLNPELYWIKCAIQQKEKSGLTFGPDPATHTHCTLGGMLGNDSCGIHSVMAQFEGNGARTADNAESMTIVTYDGIEMKVGPTSDEEFENIINEGGRRGEIYKNESTS